MEELIRNVGEKEVTRLLKMLVIIMRKNEEERRRK